MDSKLPIKYDYSLMKCQHPKHDQNKLIAICQNPQCTSRLCCEICIQQYHKSCWEFLWALPDIKDNKKIWESMNLLISNLKTLETRNIMNIQLLENQFKKLRLRMELLLESFQQKFKDNLQHQYTISMQPILDSLKALSPNDTNLNHSKSQKEGGAGGIGGLGSQANEIGSSIMLNTEVPEKEKSLDELLMHNKDLIKTPETMRLSLSFGEYKVMYKILADQFKNELMNLTQDTIFSISSKIYTTRLEKYKPLKQESPNPKEKVEMILYNNLRSNMPCMSTIHTSDDTWMKDSQIIKPESKSLNTFFYLSCSSCNKKLLYNNRYICPDCNSFVFCQECFDQVPHEHALISFDSNKVKYLEQWLTSLN